MATASLQQQTRGTPQGGACTGLAPTLAALFGSIATAIAIFGGGLAVEAYKRRQDRMALALAGAVDAMLGLIETRNMTSELWEALGELEAGRPVEFGSLIHDNAPFQAITLSHANQIGGLRGDLPFRVARFLTYGQGLQHDLGRLGQCKDKPQTQAMLIRRMGPLWQETQKLGLSLVVICGKLPAVGNGSDIEHDRQGSRRRVMAPPPVIATALPRPLIRSTEFQLRRHQSLALPASARVASAHAPG